ncbi:MAG TPA: PhnA-like protein [Mesorhizobium sp.]|jgi:hypothetical protein|nr:PhnA-like protein [Mesorhizobium sp.]
MSDTTRTETVSTYDRPAGVVDEAQSILANKVSWGAIVAGIVVALVTQILLNLLGVGIGAATLDPAGGDNPEASTFSIVAGIWYVVSGIIASYLGGYVAARLSGKTSSNTGAWHGLTAWAATTLIVLYLLTTSIGSIVSGVFSGISSAVGGVAQTAATAAAPALAESNPLDAISRQVSATGNDPEALNQQAVNAIYGLVTGDEAQAEQNRQAAIDALARARNIPPEEARRQVEQIEQQYRQTVDQVSNQATEAADTAATAVSTGAIAAFIGLLLGAIAAWLGGRSGANHVHRDHANHVTTTRRIT